eukprot:TRINITY_DN1672_c1_g2_i1.p1 TRINITY_DN1672_c1_g2~~TRINITY_DN1672_c1_g2_i1.p1  ORF type:complete len:1036 (-),score=245.76 TRINITY_DN1672_c1_g2_i1:64-3171(-)
MSSKVEQDGMDGVDASPNEDHRAEDVKSPKRSNIGSFFRTLRAGKSKSKSTIAGRGWTISNDSTDAAYLSPEAASPPFNKKEQDKKDKKDKKKEKEREKRERDKVRHSPDKQATRRDSNPETVQTRSPKYAARVMRFQSREDLMRQIEGQYSAETMTIKKLTMYVLQELQQTRPMIPAHDAQRTPSTPAPTSIGTPSKMSALSLSTPTSPVHHSQPVERARSDTVLVNHNVTQLSAFEIDALKRPLLAVPSFSAVSSPSLVSISTSLEPDESTPTPDSAPSSPPTDEPLQEGDEKIKTADNIFVRARIPIGRPKSMTLKPIDEGVALGEEDRPHSAGSSRRSSQHLRSPSGTISALLRGRPQSVQLPSTSSSSSLSLSVGLPLSRRGSWSRSNTSLEAVNENEPLPSTSTSSAHSSPLSTPRSSSSSLVSPPLSKASSFSTPNSLAGSRSFLKEITEIANNVPVSPPQSPTLFSPSYKIFTSIIPDTTPGHVFVGEIRDKTTQEVINPMAVMAGSVGQLVAALTDERMDTVFTEDFLHTYHYFVSSQDLLDMLRKRFQYPDPPNATPEQSETFEKWRAVVQLKVINVIKKWLELHFAYFLPFGGPDPMNEGARAGHEANRRRYSRFSAMSAMLELLLSFINEEINTANERWGALLHAVVQDQLVATIHRGEKVPLKYGVENDRVLAALIKTSGLIHERKWKQKKYPMCFVGIEAVEWMARHMNIEKEEATGLGERLVSKLLIEGISRDKATFEAHTKSFYRITETSPATATAPLPAPILPKKETSDLFQVPPEEVARQMTLADFETFKNISIRELTKCAWSKQGKEENAPNIVQMTNRFNDIAYWVASDVLTPDLTSTQRLLILRRFIKIAHHCLQIGNMNGVFAIMAGLSKGSVQRLSKLWASLDQKVRGMYDELMALMQSDRNYHNYREHMKTLKGAALPWIGVFLQDLTSLEETPTNTADGLVNFNKMRLLANVFRGVVKYQAQKFQFQLVPSIQSQLVRDVVGETDEKRLYELSLMAEPRARRGSLPNAEG